MISHTIDISKLIGLKESQTLEFKRDTSSLEPILKTVIAFANTAGGMLIIGVEDDGKVVGVNSVEKIQEQVVNAISNRIQPQLIPEFSYANIDGVYVLIVQVDHIPKPYYLYTKGKEKGAYIRAGNSNRLASDACVSEIIRASQHPFFDSSPCDNVTEKELVLEKIEAIFNRRDTPLNNSKLLNIGLLVKKGRRLIATNAGVILFGSPAVRHQYFPFAEVRCARFAGTSKEEFIDRLNIEGSILEAVDKIVQFIRRHTKLTGKFGEIKRRDIPEYPLEGIREAIINALVHANYEITGTRIFVAIYDNRLEIQNPGIMPPGMDFAQFQAGVSRVRNPVIARVFGELGLIEEWGSGYKRICGACHFGGYPEPMWEELGTVLRVTFYPHPETLLQLGAKSGTKSAPSRHQVEIDKVSLDLLTFCKEPRSFLAMMRLAGLKDRTKFRRKYIHPLLGFGWLEMTLPDKPKSSKQQYFITTAGENYLKNGIFDKG